MFRFIQRNKMLPCIFQHCVSPRCFWSQNVLPSGRSWGGGGRISRSIKFTGTQARLWHRAKREWQWHSQLAWVLFKGVFLHHPEYSTTRSVSRTDLFWEFGIISSCTYLRSGFLKLVQMALRVKPDGLASFGIPCGSYIFLNCLTHQRSEHSPFGNEDREYVRTANKLCPEFVYRNIQKNCFQQYIGSCWLFWHQRSGLDVGLPWSYSYWFVGLSTFLWSNLGLASCLWSHIIRSFKRHASAWVLASTTPSCQKPSLQ